MVSFSGGTLPTGITANTNYFIISGGFGANAFEIATSVGGTAINFTGASSGTQTGVSIGTCGTAVTPGNGSKSSYVQLTAGTLRDYAGVFGIVDTCRNSGGLSMLDIAIGSGGNEVVVIPNQIAFFGTCCIIDYIPMAIPAGTRISYRAANCGGTANTAIGLTLYGLF